MQCKVGVTWHLQSQVQSLRNEILTYSGPIEADIPSSQVRQAFCSSILINASFVCMQGLESTDGRMLLDPLSLSDCRNITTDATNVLIVKVCSGSHRTDSRSLKSVHAGVALADLIISAQLLAGQKVLKIVCKLVARNEAKGSEQCYDGTGWLRIIESRASTSKKEDVQRSTGMVLSP